MGTKIRFFMELKGGVDLKGELAWFYEVGGRAAAPNVPPPIQKPFAKNLV
jgi:hypothetical protein